MSVQIYLNSIIYNIPTHRYLVHNIFNFMRHLLNVNSHVDQGRLSCQETYNDNTFYYCTMIINITLVFFFTNILTENVCKILQYLYIIVHNSLNSSNIRKNQLRTQIKPQSLVTGQFTVTYKHAKLDLSKGKSVICAQLQSRSLNGFQYVAFIHTTLVMVFSKSTQ